MGQYTSQKIVNGNPGVAYYDVLNGDLRFVRAEDANGTSWGTPITLDTTNTIGEYASLEIVNGNPAIAYYEYNQGKLKFIRANDANGTSWGSPLTVENTNQDVGRYCSLVIVAGNPAIAYQNYGFGTLKYVRATNANGTAWGTPVTVDDPANSVGSGLSMAVVNGNPAVTYRDGTASDLKYVRATSTDGATWGTPQTIDSSGFVGSYPSLAVINGNPAVAHVEAGGSATTQRLRFIRATDSNGAGWGSSTIVADAGINDYFRNPSLAVIGGNPAISYYNPANQDLSFVRAGNTSGSSWGTPVTVDAVGTVGEYSSLLTVNGNPAISYYDAAEGNLKYARAANTTGTNWSSPVVADFGIGGEVGQYTSQAVVGGNPAIAYYSVSESNLMFVRATDAIGTSWGTPVTVDAMGVVGLYLSLVVVNGNPAISYFDATNFDLKFVRANDTSGTTWGTPVTIDSTGTVGRYSSLAVVGGNPAISYYDLTNGNLKYVRASNADGTNWGTPATIDSTGTVGQYTSLAVVNGNPAISYSDSTNADLKFIRATNANGTAWATPVVADSTGTGEHTSLKVVNGNPAIAYYESSVGNNLKYVRAANADGTSWGTPLTLGSTGFVGYYASLAVVGGNPAISYNAQSLGDLKFIRATDASGANWGTAVTIDSTNSVGEYTSLINLGGSPAISYYAATSGDLKFVRSNSLWNGASSGDWHNAANWSFGSVPAANESISFPDSGVTNQAVVSAGDVSVTNLSLGANRTLSVTGNRILTIKGALTMNGGNIIVDAGSKIVFGCNATVTGASDNDFIIGDVQKDFCATGTFIFPVGDATGTAEYSRVSATITALGQNPSSLMVSAADATLPGLDTSRSLSRYWTLTETGDLTVNLTFFYQAVDVNGVQSEYNVYKREGAMSPLNACAVSTPCIPGTNQISINNISNFSQWSAGALAPTAATVNIGGRVLNPNGRGLLNAQVYLVDQNGLVLVTRTNPFGFYRFTNIAAGRTYILSVSSKHYTYVPQIITATEDLTEMSFLPQP